MPAHEPLDQPPVDQAGIDALSEELGLTVADILTLACARYIDGEPEQITELPFDVVIGIRADLDQFCIRTVPAFWYPGSDPLTGRGATKMR